MQALWTLAATEAESSKAAFYIVGSVTALWAVALFGIGMTRPAFPGTAAAARGTMAITAVLVVATLAAAVATA